MAEPNELPQPTPEEGWRYVLRFLANLTGVFGVVSVLLMGYCLYTDSVADEAAALLEGDSPTADALKDAFSLVETPHLLSGWRVPDHIFPRDEPDLLAFDEEELAEAIVALETLPPNVAPKPVEQCTAGDLLCVGLGLGAEYDRRAGVPQRYKVYRYLLLRRAMARGEGLSEEQLAFFQWNRALWGRAFRRQIMDGSGTPTASDVVILRELTENLQGATRNGFVFASYGLLATGMFAFFLFFWWRHRRPGAVTAKTSANHAASA